MKKDVQELFNLMIRKGYDEGFSRLIAKNLGTEFTAKRMMGYLRAFKVPPSMEDVTDEMMAILSDRDRIKTKKINEYYNASWNDFLRRQKEGEFDE